MPRRFAYPVLRGTVALHGIYTGIATCTAAMLWERHTWTAIALALFNDSTTHIVGQQVHNRTQLPHHPNVIVLVAYSFDGMTPTYIAIAADEYAVWQAAVIAVGNPAVLPRLRRRSLKSVQPLFAEHTPPDPQITISCILCNKAT